MEVTVAVEWFVLRLLFIKYLFFFSVAQQPPVGQGVLIIEASRSHLFRHTTFFRTSLDK
jgi:hypothetical protein